MSAIDGPAGPVDAAGAPLSIAVQLEDQLDVARGALIHRAGEPPRSGREIDATVCWLGEAHSQPRGRYLLKHTTSTVRAVLDTIHHTLEVEKLTERPDADCLSRNEIGRVTLRTLVGAVLRPLRRQPHHGLVHPHRRGDQRDGRRGDDR